MNTTIIADPAVEVAAATRAGVARAFVLGRSLAALLTKHEIPRAVTVRTVVYDTPKIAGYVDLYADLESAADLIALAHRTDRTMLTAGPKSGDRVHGFIQFGTSKAGMSVRWVGPLSGGAS